MLEDRQSKLERVLQKSRAANPILLTVKACGAFTEAILKAARVSIPLTSGTSYKKLWKCFWNEDCEKAKQRNNQAMKEYRRNLGDIILWIAVKKEKAIYRHHTQINQGQLAQVPN
jgi:flagellar biosynthesis regulator FlaF